MPRRHLYLVCLDIPEEPEGLRKYLNEHHAAEVAACVWIVPSLGHYAEVLDAIEQYVPPQTGICLVPLVPDLRIIQSRGNSAVAQRLKNLGLRSQPE